MSHACTLGWKAAPLVGKQMITTTRQIQLPMTDWSTHSTSTTTDDLFLLLDWFRNFIELNADMIDLPSFSVCCFGRPSTAEECNKSIKNCQAWAYHASKFSSICLLILFVSLSNLFQTVAYKPYIAIIGAQLRKIPFSDSFDLPFFTLN